MLDKQKQGAEKSAGILDARLAKVAGVSFDTVSAALQRALLEKYPKDPKDPGDSCCYLNPWVRDIFDDVMIYSYDSKLYRVPYTFSGNTAALSGAEEEVVVTYAPVGSAAPATEQQVAASTKAGRAQLCKRIDTTMKRLRP